MKMASGLFGRGTAAVRHALEARRKEKLHPNHGVDIQVLEFEDLGNTETSLSLKDIIRAKAEMKLNEKKT